MCPDKVSIIVPVYNVKDYIRECLDSVVAQTYSNIECILVNDGSTDGSDMICREYVTDYPDTFVLIDKNNGGPAEARNVGLDHSSGDYIFFLDSDDYIPPDAIERLVGTIIQTESDLVLTNFVKEGKGRIVVLTPEKAIQLALYQTTRFNHSIYAHLFSARLFKDQGMRFKVGIWYEDLEIFPKILQNCNRIAYLDSLIYHYRQNRSGSLISSRSHKLTDGIDVAEEIEEYFADDKLLNDAAKNRRFAVSFFVMRNVDDSKVRSRCRKIIKELRRKVLFNSKGRLKDRIGALMSYFFIW